jgi:hypothetical protein
VLDGPVATPPRFRSLRDVPWRDATYRGQEGEITVRDGHHTSRRSRACPEGYSFEVIDVAFGDLTGDGVEEAVVFTADGCESDVGDHMVHHLTVFWLRDGAAVVLDRVPENGRVSPAFGPGSLARSIQGGRLVVEQLVWSETDPECCASQRAIETYAWNGNRLVENVALRRVETVGATE